MPFCVQCVTGPAQEGDQCERETTSVTNARFVVLFSVRKNVLGSKNKRAHATLQHSKRSNSKHNFCSLVKLFKLVKRANDQKFVFSLFVCCAATRRPPCVAGQSSESTLLQQRLFQFRSSLCQSGLA